MTLGCHEDVTNEIRMTTRMTTQMTVNDKSNSTCYDKSHHGINDTTLGHHEDVTNEISNDNSIDNSNDRK